MHKAIILILILTASCVALSAQEVQKIPPQVTATVIGPTEFRTGDTVRLIVRLTPAPDGYGGGLVTAIISRTPLSSYPSEQLTRATADVPLIDGVSEYELRFKVTALFEPGDWKLAYVRFGRATPQVIPIPDGTAAFKINTEEPPIRIRSFSGPTTVANGTSTVFRIVLDRDFAPIFVSGDLSDSPMPNGQCPDALSILFSPEKSGGEPVKTPIKFEPGKLSYEVAFERLPDAQPTGKWRAIIVSAKLNPRSGDLTCRPRGVVGENAASFEVTPSKALVVPTAMQVILSPSEVQLLRVRATALQHKAEMLEKALSQEAGDNKAKLRDAVAAALDDLSETEQSYNKQAEQRDPASPIFFDDLRGIYHDLLLRLSASAGRTTRLQYVSAHFTVDDTGKAVIASILHNVKAYTTVADTQRWTFTLKLRSEPQGAKIFYRRMPDPFVPYDNVTNSEIENLAIAIWFVRFEKDGYESKEFRYDAATETDPIYSKLRKLPRRKASR